MHLGEHHGWHGSLMLLVRAHPVAASRPTAGSGSRSSIGTAALAAYGAVNASQDFWQEQLVKRGTVDWAIPSALYPGLKPVTLVTIALAARGVAVVPRAGDTTSMSDAPRMVFLGFGKYVRADRIYALEPIVGDERGNGRRTLVWVEGMAEAMVASRTQETILEEMGADAAGARVEASRRGAPSSRSCSPTTLDARRSCSPGASTTSRAACSAGRSCRTASAASSSRSRHTHPTTRRATPFVGRRDGTRRCSAAPGRCTSIAPTASTGASTSSCEPEGRGAAVLASGARAHARGRRDAPAPRG